MPGNGRIGAKTGLGLWYADGRTGLKAEVQSGPLLHFALDIVLFLF
jgi:hypothetical protein